MQIAEIQNNTLVY